MIAADRVIVLGGGLAGLTCALDLAESGRAVLLLEARAVMGGRTSSWDERGMSVESGLHRVLGFYQALPDLLRRCGLEPDEVVTWEDELEIRLPDGDPSMVLGLAPLRRPLQTALPLLGHFDFLPLVDRPALVRFLMAGLMQLRRDPPSLDDLSVAALARWHGVSERAIERVLVPLTAGVFFLPPEQYSAYVLFTLLAHGARRPDRIRVGAFAGGMTEVMADPIAGTIERLGGTVRRGSPVEELLLRDGRVAGVRASGEELEAAHVVIATGLGSARRLLEPLDHEWFEAMRGLRSMPAVTIQLELDTPALGADRAVFSPRTALGSYAEQSRTTFRSSAGRLSAILAPAPPLIELPDAELLALTMRDAARVGVSLEGRIRDYRVIRHPEDFYALAPGSDRLRPSQATPVAGLTLAGDYTQQPFLATMEGAVISGRRAAQAVLAAR